MTVHTPPGGAHLPADRITVKAAAHILGCDAQSVYRLVWSGRLESWRVGGNRIWVSEAEVRRQIEHCPGSSAREALPAGTAR